jgi:hypothetical protein
VSLRLDLGFELFVDVDLSEEDLLTLLLGKLEHASRRGGYVRVGGNVVKFERNFDYDPAKARSSEEPWQFFRYHCDVFPVVKVHVEEQRELARLLVAAFQEVGAQVDLCAEFSI